MIVFLLQEILAGVEKKFQELISEKPYELEDFLVPELPKMKEPKDKRISRGSYFICALHKLKFGFKK